MALAGTNQLLCAILGAIQNLAISDPPVVVVPPQQPCIAVDGVVDPLATMAWVDGEVRVYNSLGQVPPPRFQILSPCDPRCAGCPCGLPESHCDDCTECACSDAAIQAAAQTFGGLA